jgi:hypothetical protein
VLMSNREHLNDHEQAIVRAGRLERARLPCIQAPPIHFWRLLRRPSIIRKFKLGATLLPLSPSQRPTPLQVRVRHPAPVIR